MAIDEKMYSEAVDAAMGHSSSQDRVAAGLVAVAEAIRGLTEIIMLTEANKLRKMG